MADRQVNSTTTSENFESFGHLADGVNELITEFKKLQSTEAVTTLLAGFKRVFNFTADYSRRHPVRVTVAVAALGFLLANAAKPQEPPTKTLH